MPLLRELFTPGGARHGAAAAADAPQLSARGGADGARDGARARWDGARALVGAQHGAGRGGGRRTSTLASEFVSSLDALVHMLKDTTPVLSGARYLYLLVLMDPLTHEIERVLPLPTIDIP